MGIFWLTFVGSILGVIEAFISGRNAAAGDCPSDRLASRSRLGSALDGSSWHVRALPVLAGARHCNAVDVRSGWSDCGSTHKPCGELAGLPAACAAHRFVAMLMITWPTFSTA